MAMHELALSVIHDGSHYAERCEKQRTSTPAMYKAYIRELVYREERHQRSVYGASFTYVDLRIATDEVVEYMNDHMGGMAELPGNEHLHGGYHG